VAKKQKSAFFLRHLSRFSNGTKPFRVSIFAFIRHVYSEISLSLNCLIIILPLRAQQITNSDAVLLGANHRLLDRHRRANGVGLP
jgi:hypothetical protein